MQKITETDYLIDSQEINPEFDGDRYNGGWVKRITGVDKTKSNGYSLLGDFVDGGKSRAYRVTEGAIYLDCDIQGSRKNQRREFSLFTVINGGIVLLQSVREDRTTHWAIDMWPAIEQFFIRDQPEPDSPLAHISTEDLLAELARRERKINTEIRRRIMTRAWEWYKADKYETFSDSLSASWAEEK